MVFKNNVYINVCVCEREREKVFFDRKVFLIYTLC